MNNPHARLVDTILVAADYAARRYGLPDDLRAAIGALKTDYLVRRGLSMDTIAGDFKFSLGDDLATIEGEYHERISGAMADYMDSSRSITAFKNEFRRIVNDGFNYTAVAGWVDGGANGPMSDDLQAWVNGQIDREVEFVADLFAQLRDLRRDPEKTDEDRGSFIDARADGYAGALIGIYNYAKMEAQKNQNGQWVLGNTEEHCGTCADLDGQIHPVQWFLDHGYIPGQRGSQTLDCGGWHCDCSIINPETGEQLVP